jgi:hypothetical protein
MRSEMSVSHLPLAGSVIGNLQDSQTRRREPRGDHVASDSQVPTTRVAGNDRELNASQKDSAVKWSRVRCLLLFFVSAAVFAGHWLLQASASKISQYF